VKSIYLLVNNCGSLEEFFVFICFACFSLNHFCSGYTVQSNWTFESIAVVQKLASDWLKAAPEIARMIGNVSNQTSNVLVSRVVCFLVSVIVQNLEVYFFIQ